MEFRRVLFRSPKSCERRIRVKSIGNRVGGGVVVGRGVHTDHFPTVGAAQRDLRRRAYRALDGEGCRLVRYSRSRGRGAEIQVGYGACLEVARGLHIDYRSEEHTSELQSLMRISYAVFCLK